MDQVLYGQFCRLCNDFLLEDRYSKMMFMKVSTCLFISDRSRDITRTDYVGCPSFVCNLLLNL